MSSNYDHDTLRTALGHSYFERLFQVQTSREAEVQRFRTNTSTGSICEKSKTGWETVDVRNGGNLPYRALVSGVIFPVGVEISKRESYLCDEEFKEIFGMTKARSSEDVMSLHEELNDEVTILTTNTLASLAAGGV